MDWKKGQELLKKYNYDAWIFVDYHGRDHLTKKIVGLSQDFFTSRRWFYIVFKEREPLKIVSQIESQALEQLSGETKTYTSLESLKNILWQVLQTCQTVAMQYAENGVIPSISTVDAGTIELIRALGKTVVSAGDLLQHFTAIISEEEWASHKRAGKKILEIRDEVYRRIREGINTKQYLSEKDVLELILVLFEEKGLVVDHDVPYIAVNDHAVIQTFYPTEENSYIINENCRVILDLWAREKEEGSIYYDVTFCAYTGEKVPDVYEEQFQKVVQAREKCISYIEEHLEKGEWVTGYQVDKLCRDYFKELNCVEAFVHRTGHNIGREVHGEGAHLDSFETHDHRSLLPETLFSIEPGLYQDGIGVRTEIDVYITLQGTVEIFGERQQKIHCI